jgi:hypothetical protein
MIAKGVLPEFQEFLLSHQLAAEKHVPSIAVWASKFLVFSNRKRHPDISVTVTEFLESLLMKGVNIREVQELLGHKSVETTMIYTHVLRDMQNVPMSPLDALLKEDP